MKKAQSLVIGLLLAGTLSQLNAESTVDQQITAIQKASVQERVQLMNQFKVNLANMNDAERAEAMNKLQERLQVRTQVMDGKGLEAQNRVQHMNQVQQMNQTQQMNQVNQQSMGQMQNTMMQQGSRR